LPPSEATDGISWIPVIRIASGTRLPEDLTPAVAADWARGADVTREVQFDYDCPDRRLPEYAAWLDEFRALSGVKHLGTTALGGWAMAPGWRTVEAAVDEACPMLYDVKTERPRADGQPDAEPLADSAYVTGLLRQWSDRCRVPWRAGLPNFTRLSLFRGGQALGQIRSWTWEALLDEDVWEQVLSPDKPCGVTFLRCRQTSSLGGVGLQAGDVVALKQCDPSALQNILATLPASGAQGVIWFQMPRAGLASNGWSLPMLASGCAAEPIPTLRHDGSALVLENTGDGDSGPRPPIGYRVRLTVEAGSVREIVPGAFLSAETLREGRPVPAGFATEIVLRFARLPARTSLRTGPFVLSTLTKMPLVLAASLNEDPLPVERDHP